MFVNLTISPLGLRFAYLTPKGVKDSINLTHTIFFYSFKVIDAAGKIPSGILEGDMMWTGSYDECLAVHAGRFDGKYCMGSLPLTDILVCLKLLKW